MPRLNEITSTEKLLNVIRSKDNKVSENNPDLRGGSPFKKIFKYSFPEIFSRHQSVTIGIDISSEYLRMVKAARISDNRWKLIEWKCLALPDNLSKWSAEFADYLRSEIALFCGSAKGLSIWVLMSAANVEVRHIRIPKVSNKDTANAVYRTIKKEVPFDDNSNFIDFEVQGEVLEQGITRLTVMVYLAPVNEVNQIQSVFSKIQLPLTGISIVPFAIQNIFRSSRSIGFEERFAILFIGNEFSRIDIYKSGNLVMTRDIKAGINSMVETLMEELSSGQRSFALKRAGLNIDRELSRKILFSLAPDPRVAKNDFSPVLDKEAIFSMIMPAIERVVRQVERTFGHYLAQPGNEKIEKIYVSGVLSVYKPLVDYAGEQLGIKSEILDVFGRLTSVLSEDVKSTPLPERIGFIPAVGAALSDPNHTLNLTFTYKDREKESGIKRINRNIFMTFAAAVFICSVVFGYQHYVARQKNIVLTRLVQQFTEKGVYINRDMITEVGSTIKQQQQVSKAYSKRYMGMAVISELSAITPSDIGLVRLKVSLGDVNSADKGHQVEEGKAENVFVYGLIPGDRNHAEAALSRYVVKLDSSPMFTNISVKENNYVPSSKGGAGLYFTINMKIG